MFLAVTAVQRRSARYGMFTQGAELIAKRLAPGEIEPAYSLSGGAPYRTAPP